MQGHPHNSITKNVVVTRLTCVNKASSLLRNNGDESWCALKAKTYAAFVFELEVCSSRELSQPSLLGTIKNNKNNPEAYCLCVCVHMFMCTGAHKLYMCP